MKIILDLEKSVDQNASEYFEKAKKSRKKLLGVKKALEEAQKKLEREQKLSETRKKEDSFRTLEKSRQKEWYEKFRWFFSSEGFLIIGGKDSGLNEIIIKKHSAPGDLVFHTEAPGSPFFLIKNPERKDVPELTRLEAATAAATFSKAWSSGIKSLEVYEVLPEQVDKQANSGEYIKKGAFMVHGKRKYYSPVLSLAIGLQKDKNEKIIMAGPESAVKKHCSLFFSLRQGDQKKGDIAKTLMKKFGMFSNEDILSALPSGEFAFQKQ